MCWLTTGSTSTPSTADRCLSQQLNQRKVGRAGSLKAESPPRPRFLTQPSQRAIRALHSLHNAVHLLPARMLVRSECDTIQGFVRFQQPIDWKPEWLSLHLVDSSLGVISATRRQSSALMDSQSPLKLTGKSTFPVHLFVLGGGLFVWFFCFQLTLFHPDQCCCTARTKAQNEGHVAMVISIWKLEGLTF